jgi:hypothetical protein
MTVSSKRLVWCCWFNFKASFDLSMYYRISPHFIPAAGGNIPVAAAGYTDGR